MSAGAYSIVASDGRTHAENVWGVHVQAGRAVLGQGITPGQLIGRRNALNLAVWLLRAIGATSAEVNNAMAESIQGAEWQGFRALFREDD